MRKQEYVHLHALMVEVTRYLDEREGLPIDTLETYERLDTAPAQIHQSKTDHREALMALTRGLEPWLEAQLAETDPPAPNPSR